MHEITVFPICSQYFRNKIAGLRCILTVDGIDGPLSRLTKESLSHPNTEGEVPNLLCDRHRPRAQRRLLRLLIRVTSPINV